MKRFKITIDFLRRLCYNNNRNRKQPQKQPHKKTKGFDFMKKNALTTEVRIKASDKRYAELRRDFMNDELYKKVSDCYWACIFESEVLNDVVIIERA